MWKEAVVAYLENKSKNFLEDRRRLRTALGTYSKPGSPECKPDGLRLSQARFLYIVELGAAVHAP